MSSWIHLGKILDDKIDGMAIYVGGDFQNPKTQHTSLSVSGWKNAFVFSVCSFAMNKMMIIIVVLQ